MRDKKREGACTGDTEDTEDTEDKTQGKGNIKGTNLEPQELNTMSRKTHKR